METIMGEIKEVSVIGLGNLGAAIARLLLANSYKVTVWNRTTSKAAPLLKEGAVQASSVENAIAASPVTIVCVFDHKATNDILNSTGVKAGLRNKVLIQLSTDSPEEAKKSEALLKTLGIDYLNGAVQVAPEQLGKADTSILISGKKEVFTKCEPVLKALAGNLIYLGDGVELASAMDLATLSAMYGAILGFFHGARICQVVGFDVNRYASIISDILPSLGEFIKHEGTVIQSGDFTTSQSPLSISVEATARLVHTAKESGINADFPAYAANLLKKAENAGYGHEELAAVIKLL